MPKPILELFKITKHYNLGPVVVNALRGIDLSIIEGQMISIVGSSGCGKSTLMNIMGLLDTASDGEYKIDGKSTESSDDDELSRKRNEKIGFVFQQYNLLQRLDVLGNVAIPLLYRGWSPQQIKPRCLEVLKMVNMEERGHHKPTELSGGQQQRVAIARALAGNPSLILADEPTGALDSQTSKDIMKLFFDLNKERGVTIVLITHDMDIANQCRRRVLLKDGIIAGDENDY